MSAPQDEPVNRLERRKQRTRAALIEAAQALIAEGRLNVPVLEITQAADVGMGSFYNHFDSKEALFEAAVADVLDNHGALLDQLTASIDDPAEAFACSFRMTGRLFRRRPQESQILLVNGLSLMGSDRGLGPRALRDITAAVAAGRFTVDDPKLAMAVAGGALLGLGKLLQQEPERDDAAAADRVTEDVLRLFGLPAEEARQICKLPLPDPDYDSLSD
ncbi:TetR/AcrR family transcriptional regulator [Mycobacteroides abscessus subsp. massiliense]|uniref:TetR/AcrR family transcriptional regulator n=1 Tax=Mycobacteroides abscessus TaxID=36809 RepID=UPI00078D49E0|nr:TetR/AcrR family transcriptional regulator [Mycobacteroides abscessus]AMU31262.1 TetR family transcriptional regulator [Mycobacteroides abscessus]MBN7321826.1 TetR/AcrR family transcriptional regulator [Mycobacteroides abscessus subsp. massiliense]MDO3028726.1 TetR/AcrR family transcriptional regulator [Mycobacteroides abscessus subsp. massiliense]PVA58135.1 TetR/AcrR family transcriptional regulator [Mycobacteroides abscessus]PVA86778.1 TetR/AcrR family transcriptional regulator [Mycobacte